MLSSRCPCEPCRIAARQSRIPLNAHRECRCAQTAGDERVGAQILDRRDLRARTAFETERDVLRTNAECEARVFGGGYCWPIRPRDDGAAAARLERQEIHRRGADETGDERVRRIL